MSKPVAQRFTTAADMAAIPDIIARVGRTVDQDLRSGAR